MFDADVAVVLFVVCVGLFTGAAAVWDLRTRRIPNKLTVPAFVAGLAYQAVFRGWAGLADAGLAFALGFGTLFVLWLIGGGGGGDVKLMGALSVWLGFRLTLFVLAVSTVFVLCAAVVVILWQFAVGGWSRTKKLLPSSGDRADARRWRPTTSEERAGRRVMAYALPVALATWVVLVWQWPHWAP